MLCLVFLQLKIKDFIIFSDTTCTSLTYLVYFQTSKEHLQMFKGLLAKMMEEKWKTFGRFHFYLKMAQFILYLAILTTAFYLRPGTVSI